MTDRLTAAVAELVDALRAELRTGAETMPGSRRMLSIDQAANALGIGRSALYGAIASGQVRSVKVGRRRLIPSTALADLGAQDAKRTPAPTKADAHEVNRHDRPDAA